MKFVAQGKAALVKEVLEGRALGDHEILGKTLVSLISSGSERGGYMDYFGGNRYPMETGYAAVMEVIETGSGVKGTAPGQLVFASAPHSLYNVVPEGETIPVIEGMKPEEAVLCRFPAVSMTTLLKTQIRPVEPVLVTGLGIVGLMCAQMLQHCGYDVYAVNPGENRRQIALDCGIRHVYPSVQDCPVAGKIGLAVECSGAEQAALDALDVLRKGGELSLVGVPWYRGTDTWAHEVFHKVFYGFITLTSGWEWSIPRHSTELMPGSNYGNFAKGMQWIYDGDIKVKGIYELADPARCDDVYQAIVSKTSPKTCTIFDWRTTAAGAN
ncbi:threonine dehydrogenase-like Zn-dependent dehydrogenase [Paenibacillus rhizosphaerae]|uniref:Threonine dehydrogenase-like Zn-dependent dehydrogenase n=1 Tax=Paenibacillus rhizosphaerae TaxID=297318 RepID=A0A839TPC5_9BACL|nr:zinc-binding alcohol dehydrogenase [Paenibacillus rhizosphaerae]MBB3128421.1 threonine dehydrogenase-like Zn-dependent dehydrogenase [Paenibacillus rhizosphaerae]